MKQSGVPGNNFPLAGGNGDRERVFSDATVSSEMGPGKQVEDPRIPRHVDVEGEAQIREPERVVPVN